MVCEWGMSDAMGPLTFGKKEEQIFLGREIAQHQDYSEDTAIHIDQEVKKIVTDNYQRAHDVLAANKATLVRIADELLSHEVLDADQVRRIAAGQTIEPRASAPSVPTPASEEDESRRRQKDRLSIVPPLPPLKKPLPQE